MDAFVVGHWERSQSLSHSAPGQPGVPALGSFPTPGLLCFETCRRVLWLSFSGRAPFEPLTERCCGIECHEGSSAYKFLLEIISGLHSPIFGETEVLGQFREFLRKHLEDDSHVSAQFRPWSIFLLEDAKAIRHEFLQNIGHNSYGSIVRKWTRDALDVAVFGSGQLAQEILPWLPKSTRVFSRDIPGARARITGNQVDPFSEFATLAEGTTVIIATPMKCAELLRLRSERPDVRWIDLRGDRATFKAERDLDALFAEQELHKSQSEEFKLALNNELLRRSLKRWNHVHHRPYGWEDLTS